jgi:hypothetical protein
LNGINAIWVTWENQRRNRELSATLGIPIYELDDIDRIKNRIKKYVRGLSRTAIIYLRRRPEIVFCQNPSLILSAFTILLKPFFGFRVVVDAHNAGIFPNAGKSKLLSFLSRQTQRLADLTIVTNTTLLNHVRKNGGRGFVLPDKIPQIRGAGKVPLRGEKNILFICSFGDDEPYEIIPEVAAKLDRKIFVYVTGDYRKTDLNPAAMPDNVVLTGFLSESEYVAMLNSVDATIDLTTRENCLVCGAYESVGAGKPMVLSKTRTLMNYFNRGAIYVEHTTEDLRRGIKEVLGSREQLGRQVEELQKMRNRQWFERKKELEKIVRGWLGDR